MISNEYLNTIEEQINQKFENVDYDTEWDIAEKIQRTYDTESIDKWDKEGSLYKMNRVSIMDIVYWNPEHAELIVQDVNNMLEDDCPSS